ncbi:hypothetical protein MNEG_9178 [Monoraphidium neglectum]|jgi:hypothetical protein|uniref:Uncharacterized protein n=1 Tax=Monoraphidium neglectum TaxID=145388 RepID=A0A0D2JHD8_9CHLO|nr:hypothetical protein MNEG_9178 [Monoraphidium neglectum]KIY98782.1 hypothetical protein MNEG_9178 [Monoraphidium neglectum]|eukprot:XP_013897802.1 hypothetical protein MNEG_9178 [Monoraphidium neglectum]
MDEEMLCDDVEVAVEPAPAPQRRKLGRLQRMSVGNTKESPRRDLPHKALRAHDVAAAGDQAAALQPADAGAAAGDGSAAGASTSQAAAGLTAAASGAGAPDAPDGTQAAPVGDGAEDELERYIASRERQLQNVDGGDDDIRAAPSGGAAPEAPARSSGSGEEERGSGSEGNKGYRDEEDEYAEVVLHKKGQRRGKHLSGGYIPAGKTPQAQSKGGVAGRKQCLQC